MSDESFVPVPSGRRLRDAIFRSSKWVSSQDRIREGGRFPVFGAKGRWADCISVSGRGGAASAARLRPSLSAEFRSASSHLLASFPEYCGILASFLLGECAKAIGLRAFAEVSACESGVRFGSLF